MKVKLNSTEIINFAKEKIQHGIYIMKAALHDLILKVLGAYSRDKTCGTLSPDGRYAISWSWKGLIYCGGRDSLDQF